MSSELRNEILWERTIASSKMFAAAWIISSVTVASIVLDAILQTLEISVISSTTNKDAELA